MLVEYRYDDVAFDAPAFIGLAMRIWPREYDLVRTADALRKTTNVGAWSGERLVGSVRVLSDGYLFNVVPEVMVDPEYQRQGVGRELMRRALKVAPGGRLFLGAQPGREAFFERCGFRRGPVGFVGDFLRVDTDE